MQGFAGNMGYQPTIGGGYYGPYTPLSAPITPQIQQPLPQPSIRGRIIQNEAEITPSEVAMDGSIALFPTHDYNAIFAKQWQADGTLKTIKYVPAVEAQQDEATLSANNSELVAYLDERFNALEKKLSYRKPYKQAYHKPKEDEQNES